MAGHPSVSSNGNSTNNKSKNSNSTNNNSYNSNSTNNNSLNNKSNNSNSYDNSFAPQESKEEFNNLSEFGINVDLILKSIFFGAIFYLLSLPEVYKCTSGIVGKKVDGVLVHSIVYAVLYYILVHFI